MKHDDDELAFAQLQTLVLRCLYRLFENDNILIRNDVSERSITHKLAEYLQQELPDRSVDVEYNRNCLGTECVYTQKSIKVLQHKLTKEVRRAIRKFEIRDLAELKEYEVLTVYPDIIAHSRGENSKNFLMVEVKKVTNNVSDAWDALKLETFTQQDGQNPYHYSYGVFIRIGSRQDVLHAELKWYVNGQEAADDFTTCFALEQDGANGCRA